MFSISILTLITTLFSSLFSYVIFQILPTIVDIIIAIVFFVTTFNYIFGLVVFLAMVMYLGKTGIRMEISVSPDHSQAKLNGYRTLLGSHTLMLPKKLLS